MLQNPQLHYLDNAATTIVAPEVADVIDKAMREHWANPSSLYGPGARSEEALNAARAAVARTLGCKSRELYFTSCGSESNNLALLGAVQTRTFGKGIVVSGFEHPSVQRPLERLAKQGYDVTVVAPRADGTLDIAAMLDKTPTEVAAMMDEAAEKGYIRGYETLIDWEQAGVNLVEAVIELRVTPHKARGFDDIGMTIAQFDEVDTVLLMSGSYDLQVIIKGRSFQEIAIFVAKRLSPLDDVLSTATSFVLRPYKRGGRLYLAEEPDERECTVL